MRSNRGVFPSIAVAFFLFLGACSTMAPVSAPMAEGPQVNPPIGLLAFCQRHPQECERSSVVQAKTGPVRVSLTESRWKELNAINTTLNAAIRPMTDVNRYQRIEYWTMPLTLTGGTAGDCEDYALEKRRALINRGWPAEALRLAVADSAWTGLHTVLVVVTDRGDFVLDNLNNQIKPWSRTPYEWRKRQSAESDYVWRVVDNAPAARSTYSVAQNRGMTRPVLATGEVGR